MMDFAQQFYWAMERGEWIYALSALLFGYLIGSIPFGVIFTRLSGGGDIRQVGSGNIGATNVLRTGNKWAAAATLLFDGGKGFLAFWLLMHAVHYWYSAPLAGLGALLGHLFPFWLRFKGGKGVATYLGILFAIYWPIGLLTAAIWGVAAKVWKISSLSALVAMACVPFIVLVLMGQVLAGYTLLLSLIVFFTHRENIRRLLNRTEPRIGESAEIELVDEPGHARD